MKNILTIMKKELRRFFSDRRLVLTALLPGILIYAIYSVMGDALASSFGEEEGTVYVMYAENLPASVQTMCEASEMFDIREGFDKEKVTDGSADLSVRFPADFDNLVMNYSSLTGTLFDPVANGVISKANSL